MVQFSAEIDALYIDVVHPIVCEMCGEQVCNIGLRKTRESDLNDN